MVTPSSSNVCLLFFLDIHVANSGLVFALFSGTSFFPLVCVVCRFVIDTPDDFPKSV
jgi:hypothetical protein